MRLESRKQRRRSPALIPLIGLVLSLGLAPAPGGHAQTNNQGEYLLSEQTYKALNKIHEMLENERYDAALRELQLLDDRVSDNPYEQAVIDQTLGYAYNGLKRYDRAAGAFIRAVDSGELPPDVSHKLEYFSAQLLAQNEDYQKALTYLQRWFKAEPDPGVDAHRLAAGLYYQTRNYQGVVEQAQSAIRKSQRADENLYQLLLAAYYETNNYSQAAKLLETLLKLFPNNNEYWKQLASTYRVMQQDKQALAVTELAYRRGLLNAEDKLQLARLYLHLESPYQAAQFLQREIDQGKLDRTAETMKLLAESYFLARETEAAIAAYGDAARRFDDAELYFRQGQLLFNQQRWEPAYEALAQAVAADEFVDRARAQLLFGITAYKLENYNRASQALNQALKNETTRAQARSWLQQLQQHQQTED